MARRTFADVLKNGEINIKLEYAKLKKTFYGKGLDDNMSLRSLCSRYFLSYHFRGTFLSLDEFDAINDFISFYHIDSVIIDSFVSFCEYTINLLLPLLVTPEAQHYSMALYKYNIIEVYIRQVRLLIEKIGYMETMDKELNVTIFVPKSPEAIAVSEVIDPALSYKTIEYNHHSMKGDIDKKRDTLLKYADLLEAKRKELKSINSSLEQDIFALFNNINIRHNNTDPKSPNYHKYVASMTNEELEKWYDETYQLSLICFLELDNVDRKKRVKELNEKIKNEDKQN